MKKTRREFLKASAAFGAFNIIPAKVLWGATAPSNQLTRGIIGLGEISMSGNHLPFGGSRLVGVTDCYRPRIDKALAWAEKNGKGKIRGYKNFIELINDPGVDIVHICTPPHWHGVMSAMAAKAKKDIWCEKPMTRTVGEGVRVRELVQANKRMFRLNTWFRFQGGFYGFGTTVEPIRQIVENGLLGKGPIKCTFGEGQGFTWKFGWSGRVQDKAQAVPEGLDWDMWLGPAPWKPYADHRFGTSFRGYWDYDSGGLGDMAQHYLDPLQYLLCKDETSPVKIDYRGLKQHPEAVGSFDRFTLTYGDGTEVILDGDVSLRDEPLLRGSNGLCVYKKAKDGKTLRIRDANGWWPEEKVLKTLAELPKPARQQTDFIDSCRNRKTFALNESNGFRSSTMFNLAIVAWRLGRGFEFDPVTLHAKNDEAAERFLYQDDMMREPWRSELFGAAGEAASPKYGAFAPKGALAPSTGTAFAGYGSAMAHHDGYEMAYEWQRKNPQAVAEATKPEVLAAFVADGASADALLAKVGTSYDGDPIALTQIAAVTQLAMCPKCPKAPAARKVWVAALNRARSKTDDGYVRTFCDQQLRLCK